MDVVTPEDCRKGFELSSHNFAAETASLIAGSEGRVINISSEALKKLQTSII